MPGIGPRSRADFIDCMWVKDAKGKIIAASTFRSNGRSADFALREDTGLEPEFQARVKAGTVVVRQMRMCPSCIETLHKWVARFDSGSCLTFVRDLTLADATHPLRQGRDVGGRAHHDQVGLNRMSCTCNA